MNMDEITKVRKAIKELGGTLQQAQSPLVVLVMQAMDEVGFDFRRAEDECNRYIREQGEAYRKLQMERNAFEAYVEKRNAELAEYEKMILQMETPEGRDRMRLVAFVRRMKKKDTTPLKADRRL